jgi:hypothetical protein
VRVPVLIAAILLASPLNARQPSTEVTLLDGGSERTLSGVVLAGENHSFQIRSTEKRTLLFSVDADNDNCGAEMKTTTQRGYLSAFPSFPFSRSEVAEEGETFTLSFFQTRTAWASKASCIFSFTVR